MTAPAPTRAELREPLEEMAQECEHDAQIRRDDIEVMRERYGGDAFVGHLERVRDRFSKRAVALRAAIATLDEAEGREKRLREEGIEAAAVLLDKKAAAWAAPPHLSPDWRLLAAQARAYACEVRALATPMQEATDA